MSELRVETAGLRSHAATFDEAADTLAPSATVDHAAVESDILAFGEINAAIHEQYRLVKQAQADAWAAARRADMDHADKIRTAATGYDHTEGENSAALGSTR